MTCSRAVSVVQTARADRRRLIGVVDGEGQRQHVDRSRGHRSPRAARPSCTTPRMSFSSTARPPHRPLHVEQPAFRLAAGEVDGDGAQPRVGHVLRLADAGADRALGLLEIGDVAAAHAAALLPAEAQHPQRAVAFACGRSGRRSWWCRYPARRTAGRAVAPARGGSSGRPRRRQDATWHVVSSLVLLGRLLGVGRWRRRRRRRAACRRRFGGSGRSTRRSGSRMSTACKRPVEQRVVLLAASQPVERRDLVPFRQQHVGAVVHAADSSAARRPARRRRRALCERRPIGQRIEQHRAAAGAPGPTTSGRLRNSRDVLVRDDLARRGRSARICPGSARSRTGGAPAD